MHNVNFTRRISIQTAIIAALVSALVAGTGTWASTSTSTVDRAEAGKVKVKRGPRGPRGKQGPTGATGAAGPVEVSWRASDTQHVADEATATLTAECPAGTVAIDHGYIMGPNTKIIGLERLSIHVGDYRNGYRLTAYVDTPSGSSEMVQLRAYCGKAS